MNVYAVTIDHRHYYEGFYADADRAWFEYNAIIVQDAYACSRNYGPVFRKFYGKTEVFIDDDTDGTVNLDVTPGIGIFSPTEAREIALMLTMAADKAEDAYRIHGNISQGMGTWEA